MAIKACRLEQGELLHNRQKMEVVNESLGEGYCDVSGHVGELDHLETVGETKVFVTKGYLSSPISTQLLNNFLDVPDGETIMTRKLDVLQRFVYVMVPLSKVYNLPMSALHIFFDTAVALIAFNHNGSLFLKWCIPQQ